MGEYIVSARKYRPSTFDTVVGQEALTTTLKNAIAQNKLAHAYLFCGPRGVGKTTCARIFAKTINCLHPLPNGEACNECESCLAFNEQRSLNIHELDAASNNSADDIRGLIDQVQIPPQTGRYKVFIIDEIHMLSVAAFNAFLKTLEEPPAHAIFILATTEKHKILPTILSRCQIYDFARMTVENTVAHLQHVADEEGYVYEMEALHVIAEKADGGMRDALSIFDQVASFCEGNITYKKVIEDLNVLDYDEYFAMTDLLLKCALPEAMVQLDKVLSHGFEANYFIGGLASHFRNLLMCRNEQTLPLLDVSTGARNRYREQAQKCQPKFLYRALKLCNDCDMSYRTARNKRLLVELTLIQVGQAATGEDEGCGRGPAKRLKPIFNVTAAKAAATSPKGAQQPAPTATTAVKPAAPAAPAGTTAVQPSTAHVATQNGTNNIPTAGNKVESQQAAQTSLMAMLSESAGKKQYAHKTAHTLSIREMQQTYRKELAERDKKLAQSQLQTANNTDVTLPGSGRERPFTQDKVMYYWFRYAQQMPKEKNYISGRMRNMNPKLLDNWVIEVPVENEMVEQYMIGERVSLLMYLRDNLQNDRITMTFKISNNDCLRKVRTRKELFIDMLKKNDALEMLRKELDLELA